MNVLLNILFGGGLTVLVVANVLQVVEVVKSVLRCSLGWRRGWVEGQRGADVVYSSWVATPASTCCVAAQGGVAGHQHWLVVISLAA